MNLQRALLSTYIIAFPRPGRVSDLLNSRCRSLDIQLATVEKIFSYYGLEMTASPQNLPNTRRNWNLIVHSSQGKKILKRYRDDWQTSTIAFEHSVLGRLSELDFPAPRLLSMRDGKTWLNLNGHNFCMFEFIKGRNYSSNFLMRPHRVRMMATSGQTLARLHKQLAGFLPEGQHHIGFKNYTDDRHRDVLWHIRKVNELKAWSRDLSEPEDKEQAGWLTKYSNQLLEEMSNLDTTLRRVELPLLIIHGDYGLHNLIYQDLDTAVPVDYELSRLEWRLSDLVSVVSKFRYKDGSYDFESITQFMHAYQAEYPIEDGEWQHFPLVWKYYKLMKAVQYWSSYFETSGPVRKLRSSRDEIQQATWALDNPKRLAQFKIDVE